MYLQLPEVLECRDDSGSTVLEVALLAGQQSIAGTLLEHGAAVDASDDVTGATLLHRAVARGIILLFVSILLVK